MKRICIAGAHSYIGGRMELWLSQAEPVCMADTLDLMDDGWRATDFSIYDCVLFVAGIAHQRETEADAPMYYSVNRDLAYQVAKKAKADGARQFIYLSSMSVYGLASGRIDKNTPLQPVTHYGKSKLAAEALLQMLAAADFRVAIVRPPMVYGPGCKGNYPRLARLATRLALFPRLKTRRSMLFIDNLCEHLRLLIESGAAGLYFPQDAQYVNVSVLMQLIARAHGRRLTLVPGFAHIASLLSRAGGSFEKVLGSLTYDMALSRDPPGYQTFGMEQAVSLSEGSVQP